MWRYLRALSLVLLTCAAPIFAHAQDDGFSPEQRAALEAARLALHDFAAAGNFSATVNQHIDQQFIFRADGAEVRFAQTIASEGAQRVVRSDDRRLPDQHLLLTQAITTHLSDGTVSDRLDVVMTVELVAVDGRIYLKLEAPELVGAFPTGWQDVTAGAAIYPGLGAFDLQRIMSFGALLDADLQAAILERTQGVEILEAVEEGGRVLNRTRLTLDPAAILELVGTDALGAMFDSAALDLELDEFVARLYGAETARYEATIAVDAASGVLIEIVEWLASEADVTLAFPAGSGLEVFVAQELRQVLRILDVNAPALIEAPALAD